MSAYIREDWKPPAKLTVRIDGKKVIKEVKDWHFVGTGDGVPNSDSLVLHFTDGTFKEIDVEFIKDNDFKPYSK